jgi:hypothetical protein
MELFILDGGTLMASVKDKAFKFGLMDRNTKGIGRMI